MEKLREETVQMEVNKKRYIKEGESVLLSIVSLEALFYNLIIDEHEGSEVYTFDVIGVFLHA